MSSPHVPLTPAQTDYATLLGAVPLPTITQTEEKSSSTAPPTPTGRAERLNVLRHWFLEGVTAPQAEAFAAHQWKVSKRTARTYVRQVQQGWAAESSAEDYLAQLWMAKLQREHLADKALRKLSECADVKAWMALLRVCHQLLKERDQLLARVHAHRVRTRRDISPDSLAARRRRQGQVSFTVEELHERLTHWRNVLHQQLSAARGE
jgi:hypothetical protein